MRILVGNDDGVSAPGLSELVAAATALDGELWIVAPERKWTASSHQLSFDQDLTLTRRQERVYSCSGAPADCVVAAMTLLFADGPKPELALAGINDGRNVGEDIAYSGTLAFGREAAFWGVPAICLSRVKSADRRAGDDAALGALLRTLSESRHAWSADGRWLAVNLPAQLPATIVQATTARDKIGSACDVVRRTSEQIRYRLRRGRARNTAPGDENAALDAGNIVIACHAWTERQQLPENVRSSWNRAPR